MTLVTVASAKGSPGATSLCLLLVRELARRSGDQRPAACLVDADPDGGDVALRLGLEPVPGAGTLALAGRHGLDESLLVSHSQSCHTLPGVAAIAGVAGRAQRSVIEWLAGPLAKASATISIPIVVDAGRVSSLESTRSLFEMSECVLVACRAHTASIVHARSALIALAAEGVNAMAVVTEETSDSLDEIANALGHRLAALVPIDASIPSGIVPPSRRLPTASLRNANRSTDRGVRLLASIALGEAEPVARPTTKIVEVAPPAAASRAIQAGIGSTSR